jgi:hypothetical protein
MKIGDRVKTQQGTGEIVDIDEYYNNKFYHVQLDDTCEPPLHLTQTEIEVLK